MLSQPQVSVTFILKLFVTNPLQDKLELQYQTKPIACLCMDFLPGDIREFLVGSEEGVVFQGTRLGS